LVVAAGLVACGTTATSGTATHIDSPRASSPSDPGAVISSPGPPPTTSATRTTSPMPAAASGHSVPPLVATGRTLPLSYSTGSATQVITVVAASSGSTTATLQAWDQVSGTWVAHGAAVPAHLGSDGLTSSPSESKSATPIGSFGLSRAFGADANPGTSLPYHQTTPADWWISQYGGAYTSIYNTMQTCSSACPFTQGDPNEHLVAITPQYNYAVVIDVNLFPIVQGAGSAFFLHVTDGSPTAGCVAIPQANLVAIMRWLNPAASPRMLIGTR
jgi:L,D-peptidoglycan transpeptidase YkuD (ErfK/YbiS/YcfS/YnhG family)